MTPPPDPLRASLIDLLLSIADDKFLLGCRNSDWTGLGPILEEDIAFSALALDDIAHAKELYEYVARLTGGNADRIAHGRAPAEYRCAQIAEMEDGFDWAAAIVRQFFCDHFNGLRLQRLAHSNLVELAPLGARMFAEERLALGHADGWVRRLARGTEESRARVERALQRLAPHACMLFEPTAGEAQLESAGAYPRLAADMFDTWMVTIQNLLEDLRIPVSLQRPSPEEVGGRRGRRSPEFAAWLTEITEVSGVEPEAVW